MRARRRLGALALTLAALAAGYAAVASGLDRMSATRPALVRSVPEPFRSQAWRTVAALGLEQRNLPRALHAAERAVRADPLDPAASSALGQARLMLRDAAGAAAAFRVSARLGWRDRPTQAYWAAAAISAGDLDVAAQRFDSLLRQEPYMPEAYRLIADLEQTAAGRRALAARLATRPPWFSPYWTAVQGLRADQVAARVRVLDEPVLRDVRLTCDEARILAAGLLANGQAAEGERLAQRSCGRSSPGLLPDPGFERATLVNTIGPGWQFVGEGGLDVRLTGSPGMTGKAAVVASTLPMRRVFAGQWVQLAAGRYRVGWRARDLAGRASDRIAVRLACNAGEGDPVTARRVAADRFTGEATLATPCLARLELALRRGDGAVAVDDVTLAPVP